VRNLNDTEIAEVGGALYSELLFFSVLCTIGFFSYQVWAYPGKTFQPQNDETDAFYDGAMAYLTNGHCA